MDRKLLIYLLVKADTDLAMAWHSAIVIAEGIDDALHQAGIDDLDELDRHDPIGTANDDQVPGVILLWRKRPLVRDIGRRAGILCQ